MSMKILLIDDHASFCEGLIAAMANHRADFEVTFESDAELIPQKLLGQTDYDLFILDLMMPGLGGIELIKYLNSHQVKTPIVVMSAVKDASYIRQLFQLGIIGYLPKSYSIRQVVEALEQCSQGEIHVPPFIAAKSCEAAAAFTGGDSAEIIVGAENSRDSAGTVKLTPRQVEILSLMDEGYSNQDIADILCIAKATVKTHVNHLFKLFDVNKRINCLKAAKKQGYL